MSSRPSDFATETRWWPSRTKCSSPTRYTEIGGEDSPPPRAAAVEVARPVDRADDRVERDRLEPERDLAGHAERLDDLVERQDQRDVVGLAPQPPAEVGQEL